MKELSIDELSRVTLLFELTCHLVHLKKNFLLHFCDSVAVVGKSLFIHLLSDGIVRITQSTHTHSLSLSCSLLLHPTVTDHPKNIGMIGYVIALLCCIIRELPENAYLVEDIIFHKSVSLKKLLSYNDSVLKY